MEPELERAVDDPLEKVPDVDRDAELLADLTPERCLVGLPSLTLATRELPEPGEPPARAGR
jgi:hypothetical protein